MKDTRGGIIISERQMRRGSSVGRMRALTYDIQFRRLEHVSGHVQHSAVQKEGHQRRQKPQDTPSRLPLVPGTAASAVAVGPPSAGARVRENRRDRSHAQRGLCSTQEARQELLKAVKDPRTKIYGAPPIM